MDGMYLVIGLCVLLPCVAIICATIVDVSADKNKCCKCEKKDDERIHDE